MNFISDNTAAAAPEILVALVAANDKSAPAYGEDQWSRKLDTAFSAVFEHDVRVFTVASGTAANAIALAGMTPAGAAILCHREAHIERDECGAPEFYSGGAKLVLIDGAHAKVTPAALGETLARTPASIHAVAPAALSISQANERGMLYTPAEMAALGESARGAGLAFHVDGARFANAVAALGCAPSELTWRAGVDILSFGATKGGALGAEAIVVFNPKYAADIERRRKRGGHLLCKGRFAAAQLLAYLEDGLWLRLAARSNALAKQLGEGAGNLLSTPVETNQVFIKSSVEALAHLRARRGVFYDWGAEGSGEARLVVSWDQAEADVEAMRDALASLR